MREKIIVLSLALIGSSNCFVYKPIPECAKQGLQVGAGLGSLAGAVGGVAAAGGAATLASCPTLAITTLAGSSIVGPSGPLVALLTGALLGGVAGGTAGGVYTCHVSGSHYIIEYHTNPDLGYHHQSVYSEEPVSLFHYGRPSFGYDVQGVPPDYLYSSRVGLPAGTGEAAHTGDDINPDDEQTFYTRIKQLLRRMGTNEDDLTALESSIAPGTVTNNQIETLVDSLGVAVENVEQSSDGWSIGIDLSKWLPTVGASSPDLSILEGNAAKETNSTSEPESNMPNETSGFMSGEMVNDQQFVGMPRLSSSLSGSGWKRISKSEMTSHLAENSWRQKLEDLRRTVARRRSSLLASSQRHELRETVWGRQRSYAQERRMFLEKQRQRLLRELRFT